MKENNSPGYARFNKYILLVNECLSVCSKDKNPAKNLYQSKARTYLFMLESLARIYKKIDSKKAMKLIETEVKAIEDALGVIDLYDGLYKQKPDKKFKNNYLKAIDKLNKYLSNKNKLSKNAFLNSCQATLKNVKWPGYKKDRKKIIKLIELELKNIIENIKTNKIAFNEIESGVHELRRNLRWVSIHTQSLDGLIQLQKNKPTPGLKKYQTKEVINSPFNIFPANTNKKIIPLKIDSNQYYALSWIIMKLGEIKDKGLLIIESGKRDNQTIEKLLLEAKIKTMQFVNDFESKKWFID